MMTVLLLVIQMISNAAIESEARMQLKKSLYRNMRFANTREGTLTVDENFLWEEDGVYFVILHRKKGILKGEYPKEAEETLKNLRLRKSHTRSIPINEETYFVRDVRIGKGIFLRGILKKSDADSAYRRMERAAYFIIIGFSSLFVLIEYILSKCISKELKVLCEEAESIGKSMDFSKRMEYQGKFLEIQILARANNRILDGMEETFAMQEQFTSDVAHELRTPVAVMLAECQYAKTRETEPMKLWESIDVVYRQSKKMNHMITRLLEFSRLEQNRIELQEEMVDLAVIAETICEELQNKAKNAVTIETNLQEVYTKGDINLLSMVIQNLVSNAVKFSYPNGRIEVCTGEREEGVYVSVKDTGRGISKEDLSHIFQRFYKCDKSRNSKGMGLGLNLSMKIVQKHGGTILAESEEGKGSVFTVILQKV